VVLAAQLSRRADRFAHDRRAAVLAGVVERPHDRVLAADDDDRETQRVEQEVVARVRDVLGAAGEHPHLRPHVLLLEVPELVARVPPAGDVVERREPLRRPGARELVAHLLLQAVDECSVHGRSLLTRIDQVIRIAAVRRLTRFDEMPRHQIGETFDTVGDPSPHWSDGYYFTTGDDDGRYAWFMGFRLHANNDVLDAFTCVSVANENGGGGRQHNMRWSRRLRPAIDELRCGPIEVEIVEGLKTLRTRCAPNRHGQAYDLVWEGVAPPYNEDHVRTFVNGRLQSDRSNYLQCHDVSGWFEVDGRRVEVAGWSGVRDHSWGIGNNTGGPRAKAIAPPPHTPAPPGLRQWCVFRMRDRVVYWQFHHPGGDAAYTKFEAAWGTAAGEWERYEPVEHEVTFVDGSDGPVPRLATGTVSLRRPDGGVERYRIEPISLPVYLQGGGYFSGFDDGLGRGVYRGDLHDEGEVWEVDSAIGVVAPTSVQLNPWHYAEAWGRCTNLDDPTDSGTGHLECVVIGPYPGLAGTR
jgi:hypothetical protein